MDEVLHKTATVRITRIGRGKGVAVSIKQSDGWSIKREWVSRDSAIVGHAALAKSRFWEGAKHLDAVTLLKGQKVIEPSFD